MTAVPRSNARLSLLTALTELCDEESFLLRTRYGICSRYLSDAEISRELGVSTDQLPRLEAQALEALGFSLVFAAGVFDRDEDEP